MVESNVKHPIVCAVGRRIAEIRAAQGLTQQSAAEKIGMPLKNLQVYESGANMTLRTLIRIADGLGVEVRSLLDQPKSLLALRGRPRRSS